MGMRYAVAERTPIREDLAARVEDYERSDLPERQKVALRLADAFILGGGRVGVELARAAREQLSRAEIADIAVLLFRASQNKIRVALGIDGPPGDAIYFVPRLAGS